MRDSKSSANLTSSNLGDKLASALQETRSLLKSDTNSFLPGNTVFLGMDSPIIPLSEIIYSLSSNSKNKEEAHLCPAQDGGYGMISIPFSLPSNQVFQGVRWSNPLTAVSQMKALTDCIHKYCDTANTRCEISIKLGKMMHDIDEPEDIWELANLLVSERNQNKSIDKDGDFYSVAEKDLDALSELSVPAFHLKSTMSIGADDVLSCRHTFASFLKLGVTKSISMHEDDQIFSVCKETFEAKD